MSTLLPWKPTGTGTNRRIETRGPMRRTHYRWAPPLTLRFEVSTAVTMKNAVLWNIRNRFVLHRRHVTSLLQVRPVNSLLRYEVFTAVTMKNAVFWDVTSSGSCNNRRIGGT
jgi:hypothetical protein